MVKYLINIVILCRPERLYLTFRCACDMCLEYFWKHHPVKYFTERTYRLASDSHSDRGQQRRL